MPYYDDIKKSVLKTIKKYSNQHKNFSCIHHTDFRINKYSEGGFMSEHVDNIHHSHGQQYGFPQATILLFLNDDYEGGEIIIANKQFEPEKGSAIIFPSNFMYPHEVLKVTKGNRWSMVCWLM
jgi:predicted 2-oxoglutarate/Fe(II)-dependent dioxygenase YbiX